MFGGKLVLPTCSTPAQAAKAVELGNAPTRHNSPQKTDHKQTKKQRKVLPLSMDEDELIELRPASLGLGYDDRPIAASGSTTHAPLGGEFSICTPPCGQHLFGLGATSPAVSTTG
jgi:hypothetical protein